MSRVLAISSQTVFGPVGNSAAVPALQEHGHEVLAIPTVLLSNHPGLGSPAGVGIEANLLKDVLTRLHEMHELLRCDAVMTGYFATPGQVLVVAEMISAMVRAKPTLKILVDPVIGDDNALYVPQPVADAIRDHLLPLATVATPNRFELSWLTTREFDSDASCIEAARQLAVSEVIITSAATAAGTTSTMLVTRDKTMTQTMTTFSNVPHGTGDFLAGQFLAHRLLMPADAAFEATMSRLEYAIRQSQGRKALVLAGH